MSEDIKFRAWGGRRKRMAYDDIMVFHLDGKLYLGGGRMPDDEEWIEPVLLQYVGIKDKTGKHIYVGDIVENGLSGTWIVQPLEQGSFGLLGICAKYKDLNFLISALNDEVKVIGNIYQNPELLAH